MHPLRVTRKKITKSLAQKHLRGVVKEIVELVEPRQIYVFGSVARDEMTDQSDLDLVVVLDNRQSVRQSAQKFR